MEIDGSSSRKTVKPECPKCLCCSHRLLPSIQALVLDTRDARRGAHKATGKQSSPGIADDEAADAFRWFEPYGAGAPDAAGAASSIKEAGKRETRALL